MKLQNDLYNITISQPDSSYFRIEMNPECYIYKAHFPGMPITPGVCILQIATELVEKLIEKSVEMIGIGNAKFLAVINPLETKAVDFKFNRIIQEAETNKIKVSVLVSNEETTYSKLSLEYKVI